MSFIYFNYEAQIDGQSIYSNVSPTNGMAKLDSNGNLIWIKNIKTPWTDNYGYSTVLRYNEEQNSVLSIQTQAGYNVSSSCDYADFQTYVQTIDENGNITDAYNYVADDLSGVSVGEILSDGSYFISGFYRGKLDIGNFSVKSEPNNFGCYENGTYVLNYSELEGAPVRMAITNETIFYPTSSVIRDGYVYVLGNTDDFMMRILRFDASGNYKGYLNLNQFMDAYEFSDRHNHLDVSNGYIVIQSQHFNTDTVFGVYPYMPNIDPTACLFRIENKGWIMDNNFNSITSNVFKEITDDLVVYPNPFSDQISVLFKNKDHGYEHYELYDLNGRIVASGSLSNTLQNQTIPTDLNSNSMFILHLEGNGNSKIFKLIHSN